MRKILAHDIRMQKNPQTKGDTFSIFADFHGDTRVQSPTCTAARNFISGVANSEIVFVLLLFQIISID